ncbi:MULTISPECIES: tetratricopeptide repeat protein [Prochlorococcus]|uniref:tetratricopeptide repeat protein n=1 Tax=Prochlorococcus TaxID=1218 RepID=UPI000533B2A1|nr:MULTISPECIES: tetratricopeptide repeat protein [Prochlorococcus]KGG13762.1 hypothetical protein EV05_0421 [Prochlorococcus sp. MIT 0601]
MFKNTILFIKKRRFIILAIIFFNLFIPIGGSSAFTPTIYEPNVNELKRTGIKIGQIAAKFIRFGPTKEGTNLAKLAVALNPEEIELWMILAEGEMRRNNLEEALSSIQKAKSYNPKIASLWFAEASIALNQNKPENAIDAIKNGLKLEPNNSTAYFQLGNANLILKNHKSALDAFIEASKINPNFWQSINNQGLVLYELNKIDKAIAKWKEALSITNDAEPKLALAAALNKKDLGNIESIELVKEALSLNPNYVSYQHQKEQLWGDKLQEATEELFKNPKLEKTINEALANSDFENK